MVPKKICTNISRTKFVFCFLQSLSATRYIYIYIYIHIALVHFVWAHRVAALPVHFSAVRTVETVLKWPNLSGSYVTLLREMPE